MTQLFHPFVLPFALGVAALFVICALKWARWYRRFTRRQKTAIRRNLFSKRVFGAFRESVEESLLHRSVFRHNVILGYMHSSIALGWFLLIAVGALEASLELRGGHHIWNAVFLRFFVHNSQYVGARIFAEVMDSLLLYVLSGVALAFVKSVWHRVVGMHKVTRHKLFDTLVRYSLWLIFPLRLLSESATAALYGNGGWLTVGLGSLFDPYAASVAELPLWTAYSLALGVFFVCMPFTRYMHIFTEIPLILFRRLGVREGEERSGYTMYELNACSRCGICIDNCPLNRELGNTDVQPVYLIRDIRARHPQLRTSEDCLMCGRCQSECPVGLDLISIRRQMRVRGAMDRAGSYSYLNNIRPFNAIGRIGYFGGCMSHLTPGIAESMKKIFEAAGLKYWYMDENASICCGRPLFQQGFTLQASELRRKNSAMIKASGIRTLVVNCPICYQSFVKEYHLEGVEVVHHSRFISGLIDDGLLKVHGDGHSFVYHDPCELGRGCGVYEEPRNVLMAAGVLLPGRYERKESLCCGFSLADTAIGFEKQSKIRDAALENLRAAGADTIATACPMCKKALGFGNRDDVRDIAEIIAERI